MRIGDEKIKCIIWDLDDTIWDGTLAEGEHIFVRSWLINIIKQFSEKGVINSLCSKNEFEPAKAKLIELGVWDYFVFSVIDFVPKGLNVKSIINNLQLRAANCLFIDDNETNLNEVEFYCEGINTANPYDAEFRAYIENLLAMTQGQSRLEQYKILETKHQQSKSFADNQSFLKDSDIKICLIRNPEALTFKDRIIDLANRTNQLNFTDSRFESTAEFEAEFELDDSIHIHYGVVFAYDKYGDYGLVGFYAFDERGDEKRELSHFFFSCRIMNMGIEAAVANYLAKNFRVNIKPESIYTDFEDFSFITLVCGSDARVRDYIGGKMGEPSEAQTTIIAGCTSGVIAHYLPDAMTPSNFQNFTLSALDFSVDSAAPTLIYSIYSDYITKGWSKRKFFSYRKFSAHLDTFLCETSNQLVFLLLASEDYGAPGNQTLKQRLKSFEAKLLHGRSASRNRKCNKIVKNAALKRDNVFAVDMDSFVSSPSEVIDPRHFHRNVIKRACAHIGELSELKKTSANESL